VNPGAHDRSIDRDPIPLALLCARRPWPAGG